MEFSPFDDISEFIDPVEGMPDEQAEAAPPPLAVAVLSSVAAPSPVAVSVPPLIAVPPPAAATPPSISSLPDSAESPPEVPAQTASPSFRAAIGLRRGQRIALSQLGLVEEAIEFSVTGSPPSGELLKLAFVALDESGRTPSADYALVKWNEQSPCQGLRFVPRRQDYEGSLRLDLRKITPKVKSIVLLLWMAEGTGLTLLGAGTLDLRSRTRALAYFPYSGRDFADSKVALLGEVYLHHDEWRFAAMAESKRGEPAQILSDYGCQKVV